MCHSNPYTSTELMITQPTITFTQGQIQWHTQISPPATLPMHRTPRRITLFAFGRNRCLALAPGAGTTGFSRTCRCRHQRKSGPDRRTQTHLGRARNMAELSRKSGQLRQIDPIYDKNSRNLGIWPVNPCEKTLKDSARRPDIHTNAEAINPRSGVLHRSLVSIGGHHG